MLFIFQFISISLLVSLFFFYFYTPLHFYFHFFLFSFIPISPTSLPRGSRRAPIPVPWGRRSLRGSLNPSFEGRRSHAPHGSIPNPGAVPGTAPGAPGWLLGGSASPGNAAGFASGKAGFALPVTPARGGSPR